jgi:hypothetical protein
MGIFELWKVSGIITEAAQSSRPFHSLGEALSLSDPDDYGLPTEHIRTGAAYFLRLHSNFSDYFERSVKSQKNDAIKFLVAVAAYAAAKDGMDWDWQQVRTLSQGLYESMEKSPYEFRTHNSPLIQSMVFEAESFLDA